MLRCPRLVMATLIVASSTQSVAQPLVAQAAEPTGGVPCLYETVAFRPTEYASVGLQPHWPRIWHLKHDATLKLRGRIDTDTIASSQSPANLATFGDLGDIIGLRRARIGVEGKLGCDSRYVAEIDLATGQLVPRDVYYAHGDRQSLGKLQVGHFREPFSLEGDTSSRYFAFMERLPINLLDPAQNWGLGLFRESLNANSAFACGAFHAGTDASDFQGGDGSTVGFTGRLTTVPVNERQGERLVHLGMAFSERKPENGMIKINQQPRSPLLEAGDSANVFATRLAVFW